MEPIKTLTSDDDFKWAIREIETYFDHPPEAGSEQETRFERLTTLINAYEARHWPMPDLDPIAFLDGFMQNRGYSRADLADVLGSQSRATEIMKKKRPLTLTMIQNLHRKWGVPSDCLIAPYELTGSVKAVG